MKQQINSGNNFSQVFPKFLKENDYKNLLIFTGKKSYENSNFKLILENELKNVSTHFYNDLIPNPTDISIERAVSKLKGMDFDLIVAIGGGSIIDAAKIINFFMNQPFTLSEYFKNNPTEIENCPPICAIPTTSGTGSESTQFATLYINKKKHSLDSIKVIPKYLFLDSIFTENLPPYITACTGADALAQAIESYWNVNSTDESKKIAGEAITIINDSLLDAVEYPNASNRLAMAIGSNLAGQAIQLTRTTAAHAVSYPMTSFYNIPHGQAVSVTLPYFIEFNGEVSESECTDKRGVDYVINTLFSISNLLGTSSPNDAKNHLLKLFKDIGLETNLSGLNITSNEQIQTIINNGFTPQRVKNNPRLVTPEKLEQLLINII